MRILIVEDERPLAEQLRRFFSPKGFAVDTAATARNGQYVGQEFPIDVAIVDLGLRWLWHGTDPDLARPEPPLSDLDFNSSRPKVLEYLMLHPGKVVSKN